MEITARARWTLIHDMGFGALYLLACSGAVVALYQFTISSTPPESTPGKERVVRIYLITMVVLAWAAVPSGALQRRRRRFAYCLRSRRRKRSRQGHSLSLTFRPKRRFLQICCWKDGFRSWEPWTASFGRRRGNAATRSRHSLEVLWIILMPIRSCFVSIPMVLAFWRRT